mgnify:CR=1 FL=1
MAIDPQQIATEQTQRAALAQRGAPTEMAGSPADAVRLAGLGKLGPGVLSSINKLGKSVSVNKVTPDPPAMSTLPPSQTAPAALPTDLQAQLDTIPQADLMAPPAPKVQQPSRVPTPAELGLMSSPGDYSEIATKKLLARDVLSEEGYKKFEAMGFKADGTPPEANPLKTAQQALDEQTAEAAVDVNELAQRALTADQQGFKPTTAVASEEAADEILAALARDEANIKSLADGGDFNFDNLNTNEDVQRLITGVGEQLADEQTLRKRGKIPNDMTMNEAAGILADEIGFSRDLLNRKIGEGGLTAAQFVAGRTILVKSGQTLTDLAAKIKGGTADDGDRLRFRRQLAIHTGIQLQLKGAQTEAARALQSFQIRVDGELDLARFNEEAATMLANDGGAGITDELAKKLLGAVEKNKSLKTINTFTPLGMGARTSQMVSEAYLAGLLSSPATQMKNIVGTAGFMAYQLPAEIIAGMTGSVFRKGQQILGDSYPIDPDQVYVEDAMLRFKGWMDSYKDALRAASIAYKTEVPAGGVSKLDVDNYTAVQGDPRSQSVFSRSITDLGKRMRIPFRLLLAGDEFFKTISQRGELYTAANRAYQDVIRNGGTVVEAEDAAGMVLLDPRAISDQLDTKAKYDTMQSDLGKFGQFTGIMQRAQIAGIPVGRFILPFATAPTNDALRTLEFMPFNPYVLGRIAFSKGTPAERQMAFGKMAVGGAVMSVFALDAMEGRITGGYPSDKKLRDALPPGWQPYSYVTKGKGFPEGLPLYDQYGVPNGPLNYTSYNGFGPASTLVGLTANVLQNAVRTRDPELQGAYISAAVLGAIDYFSELPMLQGVADIQEMIDQAKRGDTAGAVAQFGRGPAEAATPIGVPNPLSAAQRAIARVNDPTVVKPKDDIEYYTMEDMALVVDNPDGTKSWKYDLYGEPDWARVGTPKNDEWAWMHSLLGKLDALQSKDSVFGGERDKNTIDYDTLGNARGSDAFSLANNHVMAIFNNVSGVKITSGKSPTILEAELIRLSTIARTWPLTNKEQMEGIQLSYGDQMQLVNQAKNITQVRKYDDLTFRKALSKLVQDDPYLESTTKEKLTLIRKLNNDYFEQAFNEIIERPENLKVKNAVLGRKEAQKILERGNQ